jgi:hypothetical protein
MIDLDVNLDANLGANLDEVSATVAMIVHAGLIHMQL